MIHTGDCREILKTLPTESVHCVVTSPPYFGLRSYLPDGHPHKAREIGLEETPEAFVANLVEVFREVRRVLRGDGVCWINLGDSYNGSSGTGGATAKQSTNAGSFHNGATKNVPGLKPKDIIGIPWRVAFALQADGWYLRQDIIWSKPNPMPESVTDRCTKSHEYVFLLSKSARYWYDAEAVKEKSVDPEGSANRYKNSFWENGKHQTGGYSANGAKHTSGMKEFNGNRNRRSVWTVATQPYSEAHFATFPAKLIETMILAGCPVGGTVLDPFFGSGTVGQVCEALGRNWIGIDLNDGYSALQQKRTAQRGLALL
jgi:DNA modification methylase